MYHMLGFVLGKTVFPVYHLIKCYCVTQFMVYNIFLFPVFIKATLDIHQCHLKPVMTHYVTKCLYIFPNTRIIIAFHYILGNVS